MRRSIVLLYFALLSFVALAGQDSRSDGARSQSLGQTSVTHLDIFSAANNSAGLGFLDNIGFGVYGQRRFLAEGLNDITAVVGLPTSSGTFGLAINYFGFDSYNEQQIGLSYARSFGEQFSVGITFDYLSIRIPEYGTKNTFTFEVGLLYKPMEQLIFGAHVYNPVRIKLSEVEDERIPTIMNFGLAYKPSDKIALYGEFSKDIDFDGSFRLGLEYRPVDILFVRAGMSTNPVLPTFGLGIDIKNFQADVSNSVHPVLGYTPGISLRYNISKKNPDAIPE